jgi:hypothetical protein
MKKELLFIKTDGCTDYIMHRELRGRQGIRAIEKTAIDYQCNKVLTVEVHAEQTIAGPTAETEVTEILKHPVMLKDLATILHKVINGDYLTPHTKVEYVPDVGGDEYAGQIKIEDQFTVKLESLMFWTNSEAGKKQVTLVTDYVLYLHEKSCSNFGGIKTETETCEVARTESPWQLAREIVGIIAAGKIEHILREEMDNYPE